jgi:1-acyl-sn-glycerol-3-phosphate acyltransferase
VIWLRSLAFNVLFYVNLALFLILGCEFFLAPRKIAVRALQAWARTSLWLLKAVCGIGMEVRGREHIPTGAALVASKHQSLWETFAILPLLDDPAMVLKRELSFIPLFGWFIFKFRMIRVERAAGPTALRRLIADAKEAARMGRQIVIFPEGTRRIPGAPPEYKPGAAALYSNLGLPCVPVALNSGLYWPRRQFLRYPGTVVIEFLPAIPANLPRKEFVARLIREIEGAAERLRLERKGNSAV